MLYHLGRIHDKYDGKPYNGRMSGGTPLQAETLHQIRLMKKI